MTSERGKFTYHEIMSQGEVWAATLAGFERQAPGLQAVTGQPAADTVFTGCGSTHYLSLTAAAAWQALTGRRARGVPASELWLFPENVLTDPADTLLVTVSRSAETTETLRALEVFTRRGGRGSLAVVAYGGRELARRAGYALVTTGAEEESVAQTRSFTSMLVLALAAACDTAGNAEALAALQRMPARFGPLAAEYEALSRQLAQQSSLERFIFLGSGANYGLACEAMLKMKEMSLSPSEAFHFLEFRHGPKSVVAPGTLLVGLVGDTARAEELKVLGEMRELGATVLALVEEGGGLGLDHVVELRSGVPELPRLPLLLPVLQLLAYHRSYEKGLNPDRPNNLEAVVRL
jgi:glucosamine--fructose-6-phosphate aminotransferase (isomerizing)